MCGIIGYIGKKRAAPVLIDGLKKLEYRGYDSAGISVLLNGEFTTVKRKGRVQELALYGSVEGNIGIGHTRWATHGAPSEENAHPHVYGKFSAVHNGIIENYLELRRSLEARGHVFLSQTDSEVVPHLLSDLYEGDFLSAVDGACARLKGSYALVVMCSECPDTLIAVRRFSPLVVGKGKDGLFCASDVSAIASDTDERYCLADGERAVLEGDKIRFYGTAGEIGKKKMDCAYAVQSPELNGYRHFMRKEMGEIPSAVRFSLIDFLSDGQYSDFYRVLCQTEYVEIIGCGTAYHSGLAAKYAIEALSRVPVGVSVASEYRYRDPIVKGGTLVIAVSQSGETADTLAAAQLAKEKGAYLVAVTNVPYSSITSLADTVLPTRAGAEIAVAATKSYNAQLAVLYSLAVALASAKGRKADFRPLEGLDKVCERTLAASECVRSWAKHFVGAQSVYFIGRGVDYCSAVEGSLKLKEISYLPSEGYPAGELKHGTLALIGAETPVVAILTQRALAEKTMNAVSEVSARGAKVFLVTAFEGYAKRKEVTEAVVVGETEELFSPVSSVIPLQMLAYYTAVFRGNDPDKPRNLAKSVTVE